MSRKSDSNQLIESFGQVVEIPTVTTDTSHFYGYFEDSEMLRIENLLFNLENRMKKMDSDSKEYQKLMQQGMQLRYEWKSHYDQVLLHRQSVQDMPGYDIEKCMVRKQTRTSNNASQPDETEDSFPDLMNFSDMFDSENF